MVTGAIASISGVSLLEMSSGWRYYELLSTVFTHRVGKRWETNFAKKMSFVVEFVDALELMCVCVENLVPDVIDLGDNDFLTCLIYFRRKCKAQT